MINKFKSLKKELKVVKLNQGELKDDLAEKIHEMQKKINQNFVLIEKSKTESIIEMKSNKDDLKKTIIEYSFDQIKAGLQKSQAHEADYHCLNGHHTHQITKNDLSLKTCKICGKVEKYNFRYCSLCKYEMCGTCSNFFKLHNDAETSINCHLDHSLLSFSDLPKFYKNRGYLGPFCRLCNKKIENLSEDKEKPKFELDIKDLVKNMNRPGAGFHCLVCMFSVCIACNEIHHKSQEFQASCEHHHPLK